MKDKIFQIVVPTEEEVELKDGQEGHDQAEDLSRLCSR